MPIGGAGADRGHRLRLGEDLGVRPDADLEILRPQALCLQQRFELHRLRRTGLESVDGAAERGLDFGAHLRRLLRRAARLLLDDALQQRDREGYARGFDGLQVDRCKQPWLCRVARCLGCVGKDVRKIADAFALRGGGAPAGISHRSRMVGNVAEMSNTPASRIATTDGPPASGRHTRPTSVPVVPSTREGGG